MNIKKWILIGSIFVIGGAAAFIALRKESPVEAYWVVEAQPFTQTLTASGKIVADRKLEIQTEVSGILKAMPYSPGDRVAAGQSLATLDSRDVVQRIQEREAALSAAVARSRSVSEVSLPSARENVIQLETGLAQLERQLEDTRILYENGAVSKANLDELEHQRTLQASRLKAAVSTVSSYTSGGASSSEAAAGIAQAREALESARTELRKYELQAPFDGVVLERFRMPGEVVSAGTKLLTLVDEGSYYGEIDLEERKIGLIDIGQRVLIWPESFPSRSIEGEIFKITPKIDAATGTVKVQIKLNAPADFLIENLSIQTEIVVRTVPSALILPAKALWDPEDSRVLIAQDGRVEARKVVLEPVGLSEYLVLEGLESGMIVLDPALGLSPEDNVTLAKDRKSGEAQ